MDALQNMLRTIVFFLDNTIYSLISSAYELIAYLANVNIFANDEVQNIIGRIYLLLGVFMLFKVSFSVVQYIIDPNSFSDSSKGFGKLTVNVLVALVLLISVPTIFTFAFDLQNKLITSNVIPNLIMGTPSNGTTAVKDGENQFAKQAANMARDVQYIMFGAFYRINTHSEAKGGLPVCVATPDSPSKDVFGSRDMAKDEACLNRLGAEMQKEGPVTSRGVSLNDFFKQLKEEPEDGDNVTGTVTAENGIEYSVIDNRNFSSFDSMLWWKIDGKSEYAISYTPIISTIAGAYVLMLLITFCIDIGARAIKLCFLQMVAPIAIVSYIDPKESAGQGKLHNWATECLKTFFSLFLRLATIFLALKLVQIVADLISDPTGLFGEDSNGNVIVASDSMNIWIVLFLIIGIFTFAKQVPKIIEGIFGIKLSGELHLNPFKNQEFSKLSGTAMGIAGGAVAGYKAGAASGRRLQGMGAGMFSGGAHGWNNHDKKNSFGNAMQHAYKDISGNELARMSLAQGMLKIGGKNRVSDVGGTLAKAYAEQNRLNSNLKIAESNTKAAYEAGKAHNFDFSDAKERQDIRAKHGTGMSATARAAVETKYNSATNPHQRDALKQQLVNDDIAKSLTSYEKAVSDELKLRGQIGKVTGDIATLKEEKGQRGKFHNYDDSSQDKISELQRKYK